MRIAQRKSLLIKQAERMAQARAKATAAAMTPEPVKEPSTPKSTLSAMDVGSPPKSLSEARSPLHHPLPTKPGVSQTKNEDSPSTKSIAATAVVPATPPPTTSVSAPPPAPTALPPDDQINKLEEVSH